jgi:DNA repair exonuclease SbcCD ATPase subunit
MLESPIIKLKNSEFKLQGPISFVQGDYSEEDLHNAKITNLNWEKLIPEIINNPSFLIPIFLNKSQVIEELNESNSDQFSKKWTAFISLRQEFIDLFTKFNKINQISRFSIEKNNLQTEIDLLEEEMQRTNNISQDSLLASKYDLLNKLIHDQEEIQKKLQLQEKEFSINENHMKEYQDQKKQIENQIDLIKEAQRALFKETNKITTQMDDIESQKEVYEEKLPNLETQNKTEDITRIKDKLAPLQNKFSELKDQRNQKMQQSKELQQQLISNQNQLKETNKKIAQIQPAYEKLHTQYTELTNQLHVVEQKIETNQKELNQTGSKDPSSKEKKKSPQSVAAKTPVRSKIQLEKLLQEKKIRLYYIQAKLNDFEVGSSTNNIDLSAEISNLTQIQENINANISLFEDSESLSQNLSFLLMNIKRFSNLFNLFLTPLNITIQLNIILNSDPARNMNLGMKFYLNGTLINIEEDLKRVNKAYLILVLIVLVQSFISKEFIPVQFDLLPSYITTKQAFSSAITILQESLANSDIIDFPNIAFFVFDSKQSFEPIIIIEGE